MEKETFQAAFTTIFLFHLSPLAVNMFSRLVSSEKKTVSFFLGPEAGRSEQKA